MPQIDEIGTFDQAVAFALSRASTAISGRAVLTMHAQPQRIHLPDFHRSIAQIDAELRKVMRELVAGERSWPLFLHGAPGTGKTCAALCLIDHAGGVYRPLSEACELQIEAQQGRLVGMHGTKVDPWMLWREWAKAPLLVIDELGIGIGTVSEHHYKVLKRCIDDRRGKPAIFISNEDLEGIARIYDDRIASRLVEGTVKFLGGEDQRVPRPEQGPRLAITG